MNAHLFKQNYFYWINENPPIVRENETQYFQKIHLWTGILGDKILEPVFLNQNLKGVLMDFLENRFLLLQLNGASPHYTLQTQTGCREIITITLNMFLHSHS